MSLEVLGLVGSTGSVRAREEVHDHPLAAMLGQIEEGALGRCGTYGRRLGADGRHLGLWHVGSFAPR
jgi:hypothetical protein